MKSPDLCSCNTNYKRITCKQKLPSKSKYYETICDFKAAGIKWMPPRFQKHLHIRTWFCVGWKIARRFLRFWSVWTSGLSRSRANVELTWGIEIHIPNRWKTTVRKRVLLHLRSLQIYPRNDAVKIADKS